MQAVILAGGKGTRLKPYTAHFPKPLVPLGDRPIIEIVIDQLFDHGFTEIIISVGHLAHLLRAYFSEKEYEGCEIRYSRESEPLGTAGPLSIIDGLSNTEPA